jgi:hypothetical protein
VISVRLARRLRDAGLRWRPSSGDRFVIADRGMDDEVFVLSDMTIEVHRFAAGSILGFNGTTEWALDSVSQQEALWLPGEHQLRELLGGTFRRLDRVRGEFRVELEAAGHAASFVHEDPSEAYGLALLHLITGELQAPPTADAEAPRR